MTAAIHLVTNARPTPIKHCTYLLIEAIAIDVSTAVVESRRTSVNVARLPHHGGSVATSGPDSGDVEFTAAQIA